LNCPVGLHDVHRRAIFKTRKERVGRTFTYSNIEAVASVEEDWVDIALAVGEEICCLVVKDGIARKRRRSAFPHKGSKANSETKDACNSQPDDECLR